MVSDVLLLGNVQAECTSSLVTVIITPSTTSVAEDASISTLGDSISVKGLIFWSAIVSVDRPTAALLPWNARTLKERGMVGCLDALLLRKCPGSYINSLLR